MTDSGSEKIAMKASYVSIAGNIILSVLKLAAGILGNSAAMVSDAVHSSSDVLSTIVVIIGVKLSAKKSDSDHQYGHERMECVAAFILSAMLFVVGIGIGKTGIEKLISGEEIARPAAIALAAAIISIISKEAMFRYSRAAAKKIKSDALMADAWHHRSDAMSSVGSLVGIGGAMLGYSFFDPLASVIICLFIIKAAYDIFKDAADKLVDKACDEETTNAMAEAVKNVEGVISLDLIQTRLFGSKIYVDIEIAANENISLKEAHSIAEKVHNTIESKFTDVKHCMVHVNPK